MTTTAKNNVLELTDENFDTEALGGGSPVLVDFWAPWCGPCKIIAPAVDALADEYAGRLRVGKLNVDENPATAARFGIRGIPALYLFRGGEVVEQLIGVQPKDALREAIDRSLES